MKNNYLVTIVPPVAKAVMNLNTQNAQNQGTKAVAIPEINWMKTANTNGPRRPNLLGEKDVLTAELWKVKLSRSRPYILTYQPMFQRPYSPLKCQT